MDQIAEIYKGLNLGQEELPIVTKFDIKQKIAAPINNQRKEGLKLN